MSPAAVAGLASLAFILPVAEAQDAGTRRWSAPIEPGTLVRARALDGTSTQGWLVRQTADTLVIRRVVGPGARDEVGIATSEVLSVDRLASRRNASEGLVLGVGAGLFTAAAWLGASCGGACGIAVLAVPAGAVVGGVIGILAGAAHVTESWEPVPSTDWVPAAPGGS